MHLPPFEMRNGTNTNASPLATPLRCRREEGQGRAFACARDFAVATCRYDRCHDCGGDAFSFAHAPPVKAMAITVAMRTERATAISLYLWHADAKDLCPCHPIVTTTQGSFHPWIRSYGERPLRGAADTRRDAPASPLVSPARRVPAARSGRQA